ncbi:hypothetical protein BZG36_03982 [Bifiguratus adelaidae]|uniref:Uncharacterized protein n=1 Tax=Bifiguratus adelaidae TaxID=1938954 RepID=A0A261XXE9_9FUNG|nr:hypothetical protein BZG36_03982 [Bifiguratus adelaidae]
MSSKEKRQDDRGHRSFSFFGGIFSKPSKVERADKRASIHSQASNDKRQSGVFSHQIARSGQADNKRNSVLSTSSNGRLEDLDHDPDRPVGSRPVLSPSSSTKRTSGLFGSSPSSNVPKRNSLLATFAKAPAKREIIMTPPTVRATKPPELDPKPSMRPRSLSSSSGRPIPTIRRQAPPVYDYAPCPIPRCNTRICIRVDGTYVYRWATYHFDKEHKGKTFTIIQGRLHAS